MASTAETWSTAIAEVQEHDVVIRGYQLSELVGQVSFTDAILLVLTGELPTPERRRMLDAIMVSLIEHGISPSTMLVRMLASCGTPLQAAVSGGVLSIADWHGGSGQQAGAVLVEIVGAEGDAGAQAAVVVARHRAEGRRIDGFGHPQHPDGDPRAQALLDLAVELDVAGSHVSALHALADAIEHARGRPLRPNITGTIAAILLDLGLPVDAIRGMVIAARAPGLVAHVIEEGEQGGRWRHAPADSVSYTGPRGRSLQS